MPVFMIFSSHVRHGSVTIAGPLLEHLKDSLRIKIGEEIWVGDERRRRYRIRVSQIGRRDLHGEILEELTGSAATGPPVTLGQALLKGERMDWVIQKATELGVASIIPLVSRRVITRPRAERLDHQRERWQRIALEAAQQAERWEVPSVVLPSDASDFFKNQPGTSLKLILSERTPGQGLTSLQYPGDPERRVVLAIGPEGGWDKEELSLALSCSFTAVTLGSRILRSETAAIAALSVIQSRLGELG